MKILRILSIVAFKCHSPFLNLNVQTFYGNVGSRLKAQNRLSKSKADVRIYGTPARFCFGDANSSLGEP